MDISILKKFLAVADLQNISKAADALHMSQPPLSKQLHTLEWELGVKLLNRTSKKTTLTDEGMLLQKRAKEIIDLVEKTQTELQNEKQNITGDIYIGAGESFAMTHIARLARELQLIYPKLHYHVTSGDGVMIRQMLDKGLIDFALFIGAWNIENYDYITLPFCDRWGVVLPRCHKLAKNNFVTKNDIIGENLLLPQQVVSAHSLDNWFGCDVGTLSIPMTYNLFYNARIFCSNGLGLVVTLDKLLYTDKDSDLIFLPFEPAVYAALRFAWKKDKAFSRATNIFLKYITENINATQN